MTESRPDAGGGGIPENIARLYLTANPPGHRYRDFSASREQTRAHLQRRLLEKRTVLEPKPEAKQQPKAEARPRQVAFAEGPESLAEPVPQTQPPKGEESSVTSRIKEASVAAPSAPQPPVQMHDEPEPSFGATGRWYVLKSILFPEGVKSGAQPQPAPEASVAALAVFSLAGGTGKTSLVATLGRALAAYGERVLLVDTASFGLLPLYFGSAELKSRVVRTFAPPNGSPDAPVHAVAFESGEFPIREGRDMFLEELLHDARGSNRVLIDIQTASKGIVDRLFPLSPVILVPILPDMNSVVSLHSVEDVFAGQKSSRRPPQPHYLLNQFDPSLPLHVDVREILRQRLGERLLPFAISRSSEVSEGLAEGMTVMDYAPDSSAAQDYLRLAGWLRSISTAASGFRGSRWKER